MNPQQFNKDLQAKQQALKRYVYQVWPQRAGRAAVRFVNGNFRAQGWQGGTFERWPPNRRKGRILVKTGRGRRGTSFSTAPAQVRLFNSVGYMAVHNSGFEGSVMIPAHQRRVMGKEKKGTGRFSVKTRKERMKTVSTVKGMTTVKQHSRKMNIPRRKFFPTSMTDSPVLANALRREIERELKNIFQ
jgi:hypothetical protein